MANLHLLPALAFKITEYLTPFLAFLTLHFSAFDFSPTLLTIPLNLVVSLAVLSSFHISINCECLLGILFLFLCSTLKELYILRASAVASILMVCWEEGPLALVASWKLALLLLRIGN